MVDDVIAILDAAGIERVAVFAYEDGGTLAALLAASKPERVSHLALQDPLASWTRNDELPWEWTRERWEEHIEMFRRTWGVMSPDRMAEERQWRDERGATGDIDEREIRWTARMQRATMGPGAMVAETRKFIEIDIRAVLPTIHAPTLVVAEPVKRCLTRGAPGTWPIGSTAPGTSRWPPPTMGCRGRPGGRP